MYIYKVLSRPFCFAPQQIYQKNKEENGNSFGNFRVYSTKCQPLSKPVQTQSLKPQGLPDSISKFLTIPPEGRPYLSTLRPRGYS